MVEECPQRFTPEWQDQALQTWMNRPCAKDVWDRLLKQLMFYLLGETTTLDRGKVGKVNECIMDCKVQRPKEENKRGK